jgi:hypothetical protein
MEFLLDGELVTTMCIMKVDKKIKKITFTKKSIAYLFVH